MSKLIVDPAQLLDRLGIKYETRGTTLWSSCPNPAHSDRTPSWRIIIEPDAPKFGQHRCYGCGWGGWPVHLVETVLGCSRGDAVEWLRNIELDPPLPFEVAVEYQRTPPTRFVLPSGVKTRVPLTQWPADALAYVHGRGIQDWQIERWAIAFAPGRYDEHINPLAGRIVFPVYGYSGKLIGYTGRSYVNSKRRYKEPSKREGADLGAIFGEQHWPKPHLRKCVVVTEGAFDALAVERAFPYSLPIAGIYGSQLLPGHINRLSTFEAVLMATDPDKAGNAVASALEEQLRRWTYVVRVVLPDGEDAASLAIKSPQQLEDAIGSVLDGLRRPDRDRGVVSGRPRTRRTEVKVRSSGNAR